MILKYKFFVILPLILIGLAYAQDADLSFLGYLIITEIASLFISSALLVFMLILSINNKLLRILTILSIAFYALIIFATDSLSSDFILYSPALLCFEILSLIIFGVVKLIKTIS